MLTIKLVAAWLVLAIQLLTPLSVIQLCDRSNARTRAAAERAEELMTCTMNEWSYDDVAWLSENMGELASGIAAKEHISAADTLFRLTRVSAPGKTEESRNARVFNKAWVRRAVWLRVCQAKEYDEMQKGRVGKDNAYASNISVKQREIQLEKQKEWLKAQELKTTLEDGTELVIALEKVVKSAEQKISKLYAFVAAIDEIAKEHELEVALITTTLPGEWHSNPEYKGKKWRWNGKTAKECAAELTKRFQNTRRDLANKSVYISGLWAAEPHKDGTPHRHFWTVYRKENRTEVLAAFNKNWPEKALRVRGSDKRLDIAYTSEENIREGKYVELHKSKLKRAGFIVDVSIIDRKKGSGASYVYKYVEKTLLRESADENMKRIDAARAVGAYRGYQFFGVAASLTVWDELRRVQKAPTEPGLKSAWIAARGGEKEGRLEEKEQRGDAKKFIELMGGLAVLKNEKSSKREAAAKVLRVEEVNGYGEETKKIVGVESGNFAICNEDGELLTEKIETHTTIWTKKDKKAEARREAQKAEQKKREDAWKEKAEKEEEARKRGKTGKLFKD